ncbi:uncharacterized protein [Arachis hypogaea]|uniref:uncharacterized protein isoform X1 n=1 Tax=Arachis hypogaea TaxID=3818 RepID=UPI000DECABF9|nr:uncharacterized protein LOC112708838 isoform X1 [Arachis hypogaea]
MRRKRGGCAAVHCRRSWGRLKPPPQLGLAVLLGSISALLIVVSVLTSSIRRELKELGVTLPKDAFELIFVFLQEWDKLHFSPKFQPRGCWTCNFESWQIDILHIGSCNTYQS